MSVRARDCLSLVMACALAAASPGAAVGQGFRVSPSVAAGSELERYVRADGLLDSSGARPWTLRPVDFRAPGSFPLGGAHPWRGRVPDSLPPGRIALTAPSLTLIGNSSFPYGFNDGPVWAGRGLTLAVSGGVTYAVNHLSMTFDPMAFIAQNGNFTIANNGLTGDRQFADPVRPDAIDQPQRFGSKTYGALSPGESEIAVRGFGLVGGVSSRAQVWGPAYEHPLILGNNAGGIPRVFAGTRSPVDLRWVRVHGQVIWGQVTESAYGPDADSSRRHYVTAAIGTITIPQVPGLELGGIRFFHASWPSRGFLHVPWLRVLQGFISDNPAIGENPDNQLASAFVRIAPPGSGFEVYGEYGREDRAEEFRDLLLEPDHDAGYLLGFARGWQAPAKNQLHVVRGEVMNTRLSPLQQQRPQTPWYMHTAQSQGHTQRGQVLGSAGGFGGGASNVALDRYTPGGRTTVRWDRIVRATLRNAQGLPVADRSDVMHAVGVERMFFAGRGQVTITAALVSDFNRHFTADAMNVNGSVAYRVIR